MKDRKRRQEGLYAMLALAAQDISLDREPGTCPPAEDLAAFSEGKLAGAERDTVLAHLAQCPDCVTELVDITSELPAGAEAEVREPFSLVEALHAGAQWFQELKQSIVRRVRIPGKRRSRQCI